LTGCRERHAWAWNSAPRLNVENTKEPLLQNVARVETENSGCFYRASIDALFRSELLRENYACVVCIIVLGVALSDFSENGVGHP
jgi:hypothetical protein